MKKKSSVKTLLIAVGAIVFMAATLSIRLSLAKAEREVKADFNCPTLGVNTLRYNGNLVVTSTDKASRRYGLKVGDVIRSVDDQPMKQNSDLIAAVENKKQGDRVCMIVTRGESTLSIRRNFRGAIRGDNGERIVSKEIKSVGHFAVIEGTKEAKQRRRTTAIKTRRSTKPTEVHSRRRPSGFRD